MASLVPVKLVASPLIAPRRYFCCGSIFFSKFFFHVLVSMFVLFVSLACEFVSI